MSVNIIVAYDEKRVIGNKGTLPWRLPQDMAHFKKVTSGCPVIMGRKTWESLPNKIRPLPNRINIVVTSQNARLDDPRPQGQAITPCVAIELAKITSPGKDIWIIGGGQVYAYVLKHDLVDNVYASEVAGVHEGDTFFPELNPEKWTPTTLKHLDGFTVVRWSKKTP